MTCQHCGLEPTYKAREEQQQPYRGLWQGIVAKVHVLPPGQRISREELDRWCVELWNEQPDAAQVQAIRTTEYGGNPRHG